MNDGTPYCLTCDKYVPESEIARHPHKNRFRLEFAHVWTPSEIREVNETLKKRGSGISIELSKVKTEFDVNGAGDMKLLFDVINEVLSAER